VNVFDQHDQRLPARQEFEKPPRRPKRLMDREGRAEQADRSPDPFGDVRLLRKRRELGRREPVSVVVPDLSR
jgi:hypothetical protein